MKNDPLTPRALATVLALAGAAMAAPSCAALVGDFNDGIGGAPVTGTTSSTSGSTTASSSASTSSSTSSSGTGGTGGATCTSTPCSYDAPQCCPSGQHCTVTDGSTPACTPTGTRAPGETCSTDADCAGAAMCDSPGQCRTVCTKDAQCGTGTSCGVGVWAFTNNTPEVVATVCGDPCDPTAVPGTCPAGSKCDVDPSYSPTGAPWLTRCFLEGSAAAGQPCQLITDCVPGTGCISASSGNTCRQYCDFASTAPNHGCATGACTDFGPTAHVAGRHYGTCQ